jgi:UDPglucose 6-dehydrogenase
VIIPAVQAEGATVRAYDPQGMENARGELPDVTWCEDAYAAIEGADAMVILTEWNAFRALDLKRVRNLLLRPVVIDLRNAYDPARDDRRRLLLHQYRPAGAEPDNNRLD